MPILIVLSIITGLLLAACDSGQKSYKVGIVIYTPVFVSAFEGFKEGMTDLGYVDGENVTYIFNGVLEADSQVIDGEIENLLAQDVDILFTTANLGTLRAKQAVAGTDIPVIFSAVTDPVGEGIVESIRRPGGNVTGVQTGNEMPKGLEWLVTITPEADKIYIPYSLADPIASTVFAELGEFATQLGVELVPGEVDSAEEAIAAIKDLPEDIDAIYCIPSPTLHPHRDEISQAAIERGLPLGAGYPLEGAALINISSDLFEVGKQTARLVDQTLQGTKPADLPVETAEVSLTINLKMAETIGLDIPDDILKQADIIIH